MKLFMIAVPCWLIPFDHLKGSKERFNDDNARKGYIVSIVNDTYINQRVWLSDGKRKESVIIKPKGTSQKYYFDLMPTMRESKYVTL